MKLKDIKWDGKQISKPGMYSGIPLNLYHEANICVGPSISSTGLRALNPQKGSPAHFYAKWVGNPNRLVDENEKRHFILGRALHHLCLGEKLFAKSFCIEPDEYPDSKTGILKPWNNNSNYARDWHAQQKKLRRTPIKQDEVVQLKNMAEAFGNHPLVRMGLFNGLIERSFFWQDKETGVWVKSRPDAVPTASADFADLKSTRSVLYPDLVRSISEYGYYQQAALAREGARQVLDMDMSSFTYLFVENRAPWCTWDVQVLDEDLQRGERMNRACLRIFAKCLKDNTWPGPGNHEGTTRIGISAAAREAIDNTLKHEGLADGVD